MSMKNTLIAALFSLLLHALSAQNQENSPYSRFGMGELTDPHLSAQGNMGGWTAAYIDNNFINYLNPASLGYLSVTSMEVGLYGRYNTLKDRFTSVNQWGGNLSHFSLGFPIKNPVNDAINKIDRKFFWGTAITLTPFTRTSYNIRTVEFVEGAGRIRRNYSGDGGTYKLFLGNGFRYKDLSAGINIGILTGSIDRNREIALADVINSYTEFFEERQTYRSFIWNAGVQQRIWIKRPDKNAAKRISRYLILGAYGNSSTRLNSSLDRIFTKSNDLVRLVDTILAERDTRFQTSLPASFTAGLAYVEEGKWRAGLDFNSSFWSTFQNATDNRQLNDTWSLNAGVEFIPDISSIGRYTNKIRYRAGVRIGQDPRVFESQLNRFEVNAGFGLPFIVSREVSFMHIGFTYGSLYGNVPLREQYFRVNFGFTFVDNGWFIKRKFY
jgi:hypothetical protein